MAAARGVDAVELARRTGFEAGEPTGPDVRIPLSVETALWDEAARLSGDDAFGLHAAEMLRPGAFDVLDYAVRTAPTLRASLERLARYNRLVHDAAVFSLADREDVLRVEHDLGAAKQSRHAAEFTIASLVVVGGQLVGERIVARRVELRHAPPPSPRTVEEQKRVLGVAPLFARPSNAIELDRAVVDRPVPGADPSLWRVIERHAEALLSARPEPAESTASRVRRLLSEALGEGEGEATLAGIARRTKMSTRSLQRRLADEGLTFDTLLDQLRRDLSLRYLGDPKIAIFEVAYLLGYSEPSAFHRAFKRWTGSTPAEFRSHAA